MARGLLATTPPPAVADLTHRSGGPHRSEPHPVVRIARSLIALHRTLGPKEQSDSCGSLVTALVALLQATRSTQATRSSGAKRSARARAPALAPGPPPGPLRWMALPVYAHLLGRTLPSLLGLLPYPEPVDSALKGGGAATSPPPLEVCIPSICIIL
jgi:hypothetical protein